MKYKGVEFEAIVATPGCGKSFLCDKYPEKYVDVDELRLRCKYFVPENITRNELEKTRLLFIRWICPHGPRDPADNSLLRQTEYIKTILRHRSWCKILHRWRLRQTAADITFKVSGIFAGRYPWYDDRWCRLSLHAQLS